MGEVEILDSGRKRCISGIEGANDEKGISGEDESTEIEGNHSFISKTYCERANDEFIGERVKNGAKMRLLVEPPRNVSV